jgi:hypothetical protein
LAKWQEGERFRRRMSMAAPGSQAERYEQALVHSSIKIKPTAFFNKPETTVFYAAKNALKELGLDKSWHVHGQVSYGRIFHADTCDYFKARYDFSPHSIFNSKTADVVIADNRGLPILIIEYQGSGHDPQNDLIKNLVTELAGICLLEIYPNAVSEDQPHNDFLKIEFVQDDIATNIREILERRQER